MRHQFLQKFEKYKNNRWAKYALIIVAILIIYITYKIYVWVNTESTDNAYINADISNISSEISGVLTSLLVIDNTKVSKGDLIAEIDDRDYKARLNSLEASINASTANIEIMEHKASIAQIKLKQALEELSLARTSLDITTVDYARIKELNREKFASPKALDEAKNKYEKIKTDYMQANLDVEISKHNLTLLGLEKFAEQENLKELMEKKKITERSLQNTKIVAPVTGVFCNSSLEVGNYIAIGRILFSIVQDNTNYIQANFKETQIAKLSPGMTVKIQFDSLPKKVIFGKIRNLSPATGSKFSLLPPDNATGNFTKIVQRVPILIDYTVPEGDPITSNLVPGMSATVSIRSDQKI